MSRHREMLRTLMRLGKTREVIAAGVPMNPANIARTLDTDWPVQRRFVAPLEAYAREEMRAAYAAASEPTKGEIADAFVRSFRTPILDEPLLSRDAKRARYVAWLLCVHPDLVFPLKAECGEEADEHFAMSMRALLNRLMSEARRATDRCPEAIRYISTLTHANDVMEGLEDATASVWFENHHGHRRGVYLFRPKASKRRAAE